MRTVATGVPGETGQRAASRSGAAGLLAASHLGPAVAVGVVAALLAAGTGLPPGRAAVVTLAVLSGHLTLGLANDLIDAGRDRAVARRDKPLATGRTTARAVGTALGVAGAACVVLSLAAGWRSGVVHLGLGIASGHAYNLGLKATRLSWLPYAVTFGTLPAVVSLAAVPATWPPVPTLAAGAALGVGAHVLNALPDLADDAVTGVRGLPHRLGPRVARPLAAGLLVAASALAVAAGAGAPPAWAWALLLAVAVLAVVALAGRGRAPFRAAMAIAVLDVVLLVAS